MEIIWSSAAHRTGLAKHTIYIILAQHTENANKGQKIFMGGTMRGKNTDLKTEAL